MQRNPLINPATAASTTTTFRGYRGIVGSWPILGLCAKTK